MAEKIKKKKYITKMILNSKFLNYFGISLINLDYLFYITHYKWIFKILKIPYFKINIKKSIIYEKWLFRRNIQFKKTSIINFGLF